MCKTGWRKVHETPTLHKNHRQQRKARGGKGTGGEGRRGESWVCPWEEHTYQG